MNSAARPEEPLDSYVRQVCRQCLHAFVWHGIGAGNPTQSDLYVPQGCGVQGCRCDRVYPEEL